MISELSLKGFQGVRDTQTVPLAPLTLIFGANASGKSSVFRALNFLRQSMIPRPSIFRNAMRFGSRQPTYNGEFVELGSFASSLNRGTDHEAIQIGLVLHDRQSQGLNNSFNFHLTDAGVKRFTFGGEFAGDGYSFGLTLGGNFWSVDEKLDTALAAQLATDALGYELPGNWAPPSLFDVARNIQDLDQPPTSIDFVAGELPQVFVAGFVPFQSMIMEDTATELSTAWDWLVKANVDNLLQHLQHATHVGSFRSTPSRFEVVGLENTEQIRSDGSNALSVLIGHTEIFESVAAQLSLLTEGAYTLDRNIISGLDDAMPETGIVANLRLVDNRSQCTVSFADVGSGLSQVMPILVGAAIQSGKPYPGLLLVEQPELHLHPRMQAQFMDIMIGIASQEPADRPQVIMETHSEAMLLRLQKRIRDGAISADEVAVIFVDSSEEDGTTFSELKLSDDGSFIDMWPESFVDLRLDDIL